MYTRHNYIKWIKSVIAVYQQHKHPDVPDTHIVRHVFPKHNIFISYRAWMNIKGTPLTATPPPDPHQMSLF